MIGILARLRRSARTPNQAPAPANAAPRTATITINHELPVLAGAATGGVVAAGVVAAGVEEAPGCG
jgi:hypothetical protein